MSQLDLKSVLAQFDGKGVDSAPVKILAIRGYDMDAGVKGVNDMGIMDDLFCRIINNEDISCFPGSTDPGQYYINHPINPAGCARLQLGLWHFTYGLHLNAHQALVQAEEFKVDRLNQHGDKTSEDYGYFGINNHSGGPEYQVGKWSAGCQVIQSPEGAWGKTWHEYYDPIYNILKQHDFKLTVPYLLVDSLKAVAVDV